eukprot:TRINITY_DN174_c0_g1_i24.p1 TRINITY_DN174_c0_g1~~TRINITY_DN174_c0_g1_i24.p1  ORF type:complete len:127 (-),score=9.59 TRINITY_DN174_c0_g1_i24:317-697(-)
MESRMTKRLTKDLEGIQKHYKDVFLVELPNSDIKLWHVTFKGAPSTIYEGETFKLQFKFTPEYVSHSPRLREKIFDIFLLFSQLSLPKSSSLGSPLITSTSTLMGSSASQFFMTSGVLPSLFLQSA